MLRQKGLLQFLYVLTQPENHNYWSRNAEASLIKVAQDQMLDLENVGGPGSWSQLMRLLMNGFHSNIT